jgi:MFS family permease
LYTTALKSFTVSVFKIKFSNTESLSLFKMNVLAMKMPMQKEAFKKVVNTRAALANIVLVTNAFVWYFYAFTILKDILDNISKTVAIDQATTLLILGVHFGGAIFSALIGAIWSKKRGGRIIFLTSWMLLGVVSSFAAFIGNITDIPGLLVVSFLFGVSFGIGMPTCMGYFSDHTHVENRGRFGGLMMFINGLGMFLLGIAAFNTIAAKSLVLTGWRMAGLIIFLLVKPHEENKEKKEVSYRFVLTQRPFVLYLIPWILFALVNYLSLPVLSNILASSLIEFSVNVRNIISGIFAIVGGFFADAIGRKRMATAAFVLLGIGYTILGIAPDNVSSLYFYTVVDGVAWGVIFVLFVMTVWGDLSHGAHSDKYYAIAGIPFFISIFLSSAISSYVSDVSPYAIFSFTAFFLFLAVLPLMYAPETLPEKTMKDRELKKYIEKAQKEAAKAQEKEAENEQIENGDAEVEFEVNQEDYEEALQEAEKYY